MADPLLDFRPESHGDAISLSVGFTAAPASLGGLRDIAAGVEGCSSAEDDCDRDAAIGSTDAGSE